MNTQMDTGSACRQNEKIWDHFQNEGQETFAFSTPRFERLLEDIARKASVPRPVILNIGAGNGSFEELAWQRGWEVHALDPDARTVARLVEKKIHARQGFIEKLPYADAYFDFVVATEVLEHLTEEQRHSGVREVARVLKKGGWFVGTVPDNEDLRRNQVMCPKCGEIFHRWGHQASFTLASTQAELAAVFGKIKIERTVFISLAGRSLFGMLQGLGRRALAKWGATIASPSIYFFARKE
jgi:SAM-dependent methyltransferase